MIIIVFIFVFNKKFLHCVELNTGEFAITTIAKLRCFESVSVSCEYVHVENVWFFLLLVDQKQCSNSLLI